jgi:beta-glucosidase
MTDPTNSFTDPAREARIRKLLSRMTLAEKINEMSATTSILRHAIMLPRYNLFPYEAGGNERLGIPALRFSDGPRGVTIGRSTCFPVSMARGATWDPALEERIGEVIGYEARAQGANFYGGVCINLLRHPGWGRAQETYGEDPFHLGAMGVALLTGVQKHIMACAKHYACNSIEESRLFVDVQIDDRTLHEVYLPHFKKCVDAGVAAVMSAYNQVNGELCGHNRRLLTGILKEEWGFTGLVISDFLWGAKDTKAAVTAGLDVEMPVPRCYGRRLRRLVERGRAPEKNIDDSVLRILRQKDRFGNVGAARFYDPRRVACAEHAALALEAARKSIVLLKNDGGALPLERGRIKTVAVIGRLARRANLGDVGSSRVRPPRTVSPLRGIVGKAGGNVKIVSNDGKDLGKAAQLARAADAVVVVAGLTARQEGEYIPLPVIRHFGGDRTDLNLPPAQERLIQAMAAANPRTIVVLEGAGAITMETWKDQVPAIVLAWYPGMEGGLAIAEVLFGDVNPSGKLPFTIPKSTFQLPAFDPRAKKVRYEYYHGYRRFDHDRLAPAFPFGWGLSYTRYEYHDLRLDTDQISADGAVTASVEVRNTGTRAGEEVVQLYVGAPGPKVDRPVRELKGFARVALAPGETKTVSLAVPARELAYYHVNRREWVVEPAEYVVSVGPSSRAEDLALAAAFRVE